MASLMLCLLAGLQVATSLGALQVPTSLNATHEWYNGPWQGPGSNDSMEIKVMKPHDGVGKYPVFMFLQGTTDNFRGTAWDAVLEHMANKGFIAARPNFQSADFCLKACKEGPCEYSLMDMRRDYMNRSMNDLETRASKIGQPEKARGLKKALDVLCALPNADCSLGVAVSGHSQGAWMSAYLGTIDSRITAMLPLSYGGNIDGGTDCVLAENLDNFVPRNKRRTAIGAQDDLVGDGVETMKLWSGYACNGTAPVNCIQPDGSGYYVLAGSEYTAADNATGVAIAGHSFGWNEDPITPNTLLIPTFANGTKAWSLGPMYDWLATAAATPRSISTTSAAYHGVGSPICMLSATIMIGFVL